MVQGYEPPIQNSHIEHIVEDPSTQSQLYIQGTSNSNGPGTPCPRSLDGDSQDENNCDATGNPDIHKTNMDDSPPVCWLSIEAETEESRKSLRMVIEQIFWLVWLFSKGESILCSNACRGFVFIRCMLVYRLLMSPSHNQRP